MLLWVPRITSLIFNKNINIIGYPIIANRETLTEKETLFEPYAVNHTV